MIISDIGLDTPEKAKDFVTEAISAVKTVPETDGNKDIADKLAILSKTRKFINNNRQELQTQLIRALEKMDWANLVVSFYGETNVGKSTLIEAICLYIRQHDGVVKEESVKRQGETIGDGRSDFTRETRDYECRLDENTFTLLDVPGIEGDESKVQSEINKAVSRSQIVFYITRKPTPPQTSGDDKKRDGSGERIEGTLEKIHKQLQNEAVLIRIYNKSVTSPRTIEDGLRKSPEEYEQLKRSDEIMEEHLGSAYKGHIILSALPAFLAQTDAPLDEKKTKQRDKFRARLNKEQLLKCSGLEDFFKKLKNEFLPYSKEVVEDANLAKLYKIVEEIALEYESNFEAYKEKLKKAYEISQQNRRDYNILKKEVSSDIDEKAASIENSFIDSVRSELKSDEKLYSRWNGDGTVKKKIVAVLQHQSERIAAELPSALKDFVAKYTYKIQEIENDTDEKMSISRASSINGIDDQDIAKIVEVDVATGISWWSLGGGVAAAIFFSEGAALWLAGSLIPAFRKFFSSDFRKEQINNSIEVNLEEKIRPEIRVNIRGKMNELKMSISNSIGKVQEKHVIQEDYLRETIKCLTETHEDLERILRNYKDYRLAKK